MSFSHSDATGARNVLWDAIGIQLTLVDHGGPRPVVGGKWEIEGVLGRGGFGLVCAARDRTLPRRVAIKLFPPGPRMTTLMREARSLALLDHPTIVTIIDVAGGSVECGERSLPCGWIAMQLVEGETLERWAGRGHVRAAQVVDVIVEAGRALAYAHGKGVMHRDLKPTNIMIDTRERPHVIDFGLAIAPLSSLADERGRRAHDRGDALGTRATATGFVRGTPRYMAPEIIDGQYSQASDQFSLAIVAWEALTGTHPRDGAGKPRHARRGDRSTWERIEPVLQRGMASMPSSRFESMEAFCDALETAARSPWRRRLWVAGFVLVATSVPAAYWAGTQASPEEPQSKAAARPELAMPTCEGLEDWSGQWSLTGKIVWTEYSNQLVQIRPMTLDVTPLEGCELQLDMSKFQPAMGNRSDEVLSASTTLAPTRVSDDSWALAYDLEFPGDRRTYGKDEHHGFALTLDHAHDGEARIRGAFWKAQTRGGLVLRKGWFLGRRSGPPTLAEVEAHDYPCNARCRVSCAGDEATQACIERRCAPHAEPLSDPCGPPSDDFVIPLRARAERRHLQKGTRFGAVNAGKPGDCEANAIRIAGRWWVWRVTEDGPELSRVDVIPNGCQLQATLRRVGTNNDVTMGGEITEMGVWYLARDPLRLVDPETLILAGTGPAFGIDMAETGRPLRGFRR